MKKELWEVARDAFENYPLSNPSNSWEGCFKSVADAVIAEYEQQQKVDADPYAHLKAALAAGKRIRVKYGSNNTWGKYFGEEADWEFCSPPENYEIEPDADPYAEIKAAASDPTKEIRFEKGPWRDDARGWGFQSPDNYYRPECYEIRDKPKPMKKVKVLAWFNGAELFWLVEGSEVNTGRFYKRVPNQDKEIEVEE